MEEDQQQMPLPSTSGVGGVVVNIDDVVPHDAFVATSTIEGEGGAASLKKDKVYASGEQIRAVFSNRLVSLKLLKQIPIL